MSSHFGHPRWFGKAPLLSSQNSSMRVSSTFHFHRYPATFTNVHETCVLFYSFCGCLQNSSGRTQMFTKFQARFQFFHLGSGVPTLTLPTKWFYTLGEEYKAHARACGMTSTARRHEEPGYRSPCVTVRKLPLQKAFESKVATSMLRGERIHLV